MVTNVLPAEVQTARSSIQEACARIPPLWPLQNFVAVNPFLGLSELPFNQAAELLERLTPGGMLMDASYYIDQIQSGAIGEQDVRFALAERNNAFAPLAPVSWLTQQLRQKEISRRLLTVAEWLDQTRGSRWADFVIDEISKWCSSYWLVWGISGWIQSPLTDSVR